MTNLFVFLIVVLLVVILFLIYKNVEIRNSHAKTMYQLQQLVISLNQKQKMLNDKVFISDKYNAAYRNDMKNLGDDVVELQKVFMEIISKGNNN